VNEIKESSAGDVMSVRKVSCIIVARPEQSRPPDLSELYSRADDGRRHCIIEMWGKSRPRDSTVSTVDER
jgi:hypothetical protein